MLNPLNIILIIIIAFVFYKLRSVLGMRNEEDKQAASKKKQTKKPEPIIIDNENEKAQSPQPANDGEGRGRGIHAFLQTSPDFNEGLFLEGASRAYQMILAAFAAGDLSPVQKLLSEEVYNSFQSAITARQSQGKRLISKITNQHRPSLEDALVIEVLDEHETSNDKLEVQLEVRFRAEIISHLVADDEKSDDIPEHIKPKASDELWVFEQSLSKKENNIWKVVRIS